MGTWAAWNRDADDGFCWGWYKNLLTQEVNAASTRRQDVWWDRMVLGWPRLFLPFLPGCCASLTTARSLKSGLEAAGGMQMEL